MIGVNKLFPDAQGVVLEHRESRVITPLILASASPAKKAILRVLGFEFEIDPADIDERGFQADFPRDLVQIIAVAKLDEVLPRHSKGVIVSADTLIFHEGEPMGKPKDNQEAHVMLTQLSGGVHHAMTGIALWDSRSSQTICHVEESEVVFHDLTDKQIQEYVATGEPMGKAGAYALQGKGRELVKSLSGDVSNVYGLPVTSFLKLLSKLNYKPIPQ